MRDPSDKSTASMDMSTLIGYARVSTAEQSLEMQIEALKNAGCHQVFTDVASGAKADRPGLEKALEYLREGDTLLVWKIDRLGRSLAHLVQTVEALRERGVGFRSLTDAGIDTTTRNGKLLFNLFATLAEFERDLIRERTKAGLANASARGRNGGRRPVVTPAKLARAQKLMRAEAAGGKGLTVREAAAAINVGKTALYEALKEAGDIGVTQQSDE
ncbi:TPA: recombinase family protein [Kluyvera ascorbata]|jgi:DNA invertase Pin-like site-specific DNA recombinase|nr:MULTISPECIES: recombinase family protein [Pseudomonas]EIE9938037.1 recombinase family protein [Escherichia coli]HCR3985096.1 recombinase family protein [Kluyvera ascorbata]